MISVHDLRHCQDHAPKLTPMATLLTEVVDYFVRHGPDGQPASIVEHREVQVTAADGTITSPIQRTTVVTHHNVWLLGYATAQYRC